MYGGANRGYGELAITAIDAPAKHGIGPCLMEAIIDYAKMIGIREIVGKVLAGNRPMLALCHDLGFPLTTVEGGCVETRLILK